MQELLHTSSKMREYFEAKAVPFETGYQLCFMCLGKGCDFCFNHGKVLFSEAAPIKLYRSRGLRVVRPQWALAKVATVGYRLDHELYLSQQRYTGLEDIYFRRVSDLSALRKKEKRQNRVLVVGIVALTTAYALVLAWMYHHSIIVK